eukprot:351790-Chlamydomonas_euryale.AAC.4
MQKIARHGQSGADAVLKAEALQIVVADEPLAPSPPAPPTTHNLKPSHPGQSSQPVGIPALPLATEAPPSSV